MVKLPIAWTSWCAENALRQGVKFRAAALIDIIRQLARRCFNRHQSEAHMSHGSARVLNCYKLVCMIAVIFLFSGFVPDDAQAARTCIFSWAVPGTYKVSGNFRGTTETASARLTNDCRVFFQVPGVFSGGPVRRSGRCLRFSFKVEGKRRVFSARWCNTYGIVPWQGRSIRARVSPWKAAPVETPKRQNFNRK